MTTRHGIDFRSLPFVDPSVGLPDPDILTTEWLDPPSTAGTATYPGWDGIAPSGE